MTDSRHFAERHTGRLDYSAFIAAKGRGFSGSGVVYATRNPALYDFQSEIVGRALEKGRYAVFADCGLGKTLIELEWASNIPGRVLILAPIAVTHQIESEAARFGFSAAVRADQESVGDEKITITNYEKLHRFDPSAFSGTVLDESSILKSYTGKIRTAIIEAFGAHRFRLAATATPAPNDFMELGNHSQFLGVMTRTEMLSMFFVHDGGKTQDWRLKGHAMREYWRWVGSWACMVRSPADLGYDQNGFNLPPLNVHHEVVDGQFQSNCLIPGFLPLDIRARREARRRSLDERIERARQLDNGDSYLLWCDLNDESRKLARAIDGAAEVTGSDSENDKRSSLLGFAEGRVRALVTKPRIGGWGMNWQVCNRMAFVGLSDSYEAFYQATRRCWRYGQRRAVDVFLVYSQPEAQVIANVLAKEAAHKEMQDRLIAEVHR